MGMFGSVAGLPSVSFLPDSNSSGGISLTFIAEGDTRNVHIANHAFNAALVTAGNLDIGKTGWGGCHARRRSAEEAFIAPIEIVPMVAQLNT